MSDLKLIAKKDEVEREIACWNEQKEKHGEIWSMEEAYLVVLQDWLTLHAEVERLRAALEWYADAENYTPIAHSSGGVYQRVIYDDGKRASRALEGKE